MHSVIEVEGFVKRISKVMSYNETFMKVLATCKSGENRAIYKIMSNGPSLTLDAVNLTKPTAVNLTYSLMLPGSEQKFGDATHIIDFIDYDSSLKLSMLPGKVKSKVMNSLVLNFDSILRIEGSFLEVKQGQKSDSFEIVDRFPMNNDYNIQLSSTHLFD